MPVIRSCFCCPPAEVRGDRPVLGTRLRPHSDLVGCGGDVKHLHIMQMHLIMCFQ